MRKKHLLNIAACAVAIAAFATTEAAAQSAKTVPYYEPFGDFSAFDTYTVLDENNDGNTWTFDDIDFAAVSGRTAGADDWLITPPLELKAGVLYVLSMKVKALAWFPTETFVVAMGKGNSAQDMSTTLVEQTEVDDGGITVTKEFRVTADGTYYFGVHHNTADDGGGMGDPIGLSVDDIKVDFGVVNEAPAKVSGLSVVAGDKGALEATVSFNVPSVNIGGSGIEGIDKAVVYRDGEAVKTFTDGLAANARMEYTDKQVPAGNHIYSVVPINSYGNGIADSAKVFVGVDVPEQPSGVKLSVNAEGKAVVTWKAVDKGANGGYIDLSSVTYSVKSQGEVVASGIKDTQYVDSPEMDGAQKELYYQVNAKSASGESKYSRSNGLVVGDPYALPFAESFANNSYSYLWTEEHSFVSGRWSIIRGDETVPAQDADGYMCSITPITPNGGDAWLRSGKIALDGKKNAVLEFYYYYHYPVTDEFSVAVSADGGEFETVKTFDISQTDGVRKWTKVQIPLEKYADSKYIQIGFYEKYVRGDQTLVYIDNVKVRELFGIDLAVSTAKKPKKMTANMEYDFEAAVENKGKDAVDGNYVVELYCDGAKISSAEGRALESGSRDTLAFKVAPGAGQNGSSHSYYFKVSCGGDENKANDQADSFEIPVTSSVYPAAASLSGKGGGDGSVHLAWAAPSQVGDPEAVTDDMESYESFAYDQIGDWTVIDRDGGSTYGIEGFEFPNNGKAMSFMVFNAAKAGLLTNDDRIKVWGAHSGDQVLASFSSPERTNDDWLVSPLLAGGAQDVKFYVKSKSATDGLETFEVLYSTTNDDPDSFKKIEADGLIGEAPTVWTEVNAPLPEGAKFFAVRCTSADHYVLYVDDISYTPDNGKATLSGYNIYRDGVKLNADPVEGTSYTDNVPDDAAHVYNVTAVYDKGESDYSNAVSVSASTSVEGVEKAGASVSAEPGAIVVSNAGGKPLAVYALDGRLVYSGKGEAMATVSVAKGSYMVKVGNKAFKIAVK